MIVTKLFSAATRKHITVGQNYFKGGGHMYVWGQKYIKYNNNSENFKGERFLLPPPPPP